MVDGNTTRNPLVADYSEWRARDYFQTYYSEVVLPDEQAVIAYQIDVLRAAFDANKNDGRAAYYLGNALASKNRDKEALAAWRDTVRLDPSNTIAQRNFARDVEGRNARA